MAYVFICYARQDQDFVLELARRLKDRGVRIWIDQWDIPPSVDWDQSIDDALYACECLLIVLSPNAVVSREVRSELRAALDEDKIIVPVLYQPCKVPRQLRMIQHIDLTTCGPDDEEAVNRLLRALGAAGAYQALPAGPDSASSYAGLLPDEQLVLEHLRHKPDISWTENTISASLRLVLVDQTAPIPDIVAAVRSLVRKGFLLANENGRIVVGPEAVEYYEQRRRRGDGSFHR